MRLGGVCLKQVFGALQSCSALTLQFSRIVDNINAHSDEAMKAHRGSITCSRSQRLDWIQTQVCVPHTPLGGGSEGHWITPPTHIGLLENPGSEAKGQPGIFRIEDKVMDKSEQPQVAQQVCGRAWPKRNPGVLT